MIRHRDQLDILSKSLRVPIAVDRDLHRSIRSSNDECYTYCEIYADLRADTREALR